MRVGGYVKADAIFDFDGHGDPDQFLLGQIAVYGSPEAARDGYFNAHARETRFNLDFRETTPGEPAKQAFVEVDFFTPPDSQCRIAAAPCLCRLRQCPRGTFVDDG